LAHVDQVRRADCRNIRKVDNRAIELEDAVVAARREQQLAHFCLHQPPPGAVA
jgi:hypothetical protein